jgi:hypothetical protein
MPEDKRSFEVQTVNIQSVHPREKMNRESGSIKKQSHKSKIQRTTFSRDIILRLIDWLEKE